METHTAWGHCQEDISVWTVLISPSSPRSTIFRSLIRQVGQTPEKSLTSAWTHSSPQIWQLTLPSHLPALLSLWHTHTHTLEARHTHRCSHSSQFPSHLNTHTHTHAPTGKFVSVHFLPSSHSHTYAHAPLHTHRAEPHFDYEGKKEVLQGRKSYRNVRCVTVTFDGGERESVQKTAASHFVSSLIPPEIFGQRHVRFTI